MLVMETIAKIRLRHGVKKQAIKQIARELKLSKNTVRKVIREERTSHTYRRLKPWLPRLGAYQEQLKTWLTEESKLPKPQRCTGRRLHERLKAIGYEGAYDSVQRFVRRFKQDTGHVKEAYVPLAFAPGEAYQFDWSQEIVELGGVIQTIRIAHFRLCYSRLSFVIAFVRETQEMLFEAHEKAFAFFGGIPLRGIYDNMKTAIDAVFQGKERKFNSRFLEMTTHYLVEPTACTPASGWEKGQVENQVGNIREWFFTPRLKFETLEDLNAHLEKRCLELAQVRKHPEQKHLTIQEVFEQQEASSLRPLVSSFDGYKALIARVSSTCLVTFDRNRYSVPVMWANQTVTLRAYATKLILLAEGKVIAEHKRQFGRDKTFCNPWHYVPLLERKPGALRNGLPFQEWKLPTAIEQVRAHLMKRAGGDRECADIFLSTAKYGLEAVNAACSLAIKDQVVSADIILNFLNRLADPPPKTPLSQSIALQQEPLANCNRYNQLLQGSVPCQQHS